MSPHFALIYQFCVVGLGIAALGICAQRARRSRREDLTTFVLFWALFTAWLIAKLLREYLFLNVGDLDPVVGLLFYAVDVDLGYLMVAAVLRYLHVLGDVKGRAVRDAVVLTGVLISIVAVAPPWGIRFDPQAWIIEFRLGFWLAEGFYLLGLAYAVFLAWLSLARGYRGESRAFLLVLAMFATGGLIESSFGFASDILDPVVAMGGGGIMFSSLLYVVYAVFLIVHGGIKEMARSPSSKVDSLAEQADRLGLSEREREVAALLLAGHGNKRIAAELFVSVATVKTHLYRIYRKAGVGSRFALTQLLQGGRRPQPHPLSGEDGAQQE